MRKATLEDELQINFIINIQIFLTFGYGGTFLGAVSARITGGCSRLKNSLFLTGISYIGHTTMRYLKNIDI